MDLRGANIQATEARDRLAAKDREIEDLRRSRDEWRENFHVLCRALVGNTGLSAIEEAHKLRKLHPLSLLD